MLFIIQPGTHTRQHLFRESSWIEKERTTNKRRLPHFCLLSTVVFLPFFHYNKEREREWAVKNLLNSGFIISLIVCIITTSAKKTRIDKHWYPHKHIWEREKSTNDCNGLHFKTTSIQQNIHNSFCWNEISERLSAGQRHNKNEFYETVAF